LRHDIVAYHCGEWSAEAIPVKKNNTKQLLQTEEEKRMKKGILYVCLAVLFWQGVAFAAFIDNGNGTITDTGTGLMWQKATAPGTYTWEQALTYCENLTLPVGGYSDWRLPNRNELQSIVDYSRYNPAIDTTYFPGTVASDYWSSTTIAGNTYYAWYVFFYIGGVYDYNKTYGYYVRAVRGGQCGSFGDLAIAMTPMSGPPGTTFVQWGTGFTHYGTATLHFKKPTGDEYPTQTINLDNIGHFEINYTAPANKPPGVYTWWGIDDTTSRISNEVSYTIEGVAGQVHHFAFSQNGGDISAQTVNVPSPSPVTLQAFDYAGNLVTSFNGKVNISADCLAISPTYVTLNNGVASFTPTLFNVSQNAKLHAQAGTITGESNVFLVNGNCANPTITGNAVFSVNDTCANPIVTGNVISPDKEPIADATVHFSLAWGGAEIATATTDAQGKYSKNVPPGNYRVWATQNNHISNTVYINTALMNGVSSLIMNYGLRPIIFVPGIMGSTINVNGSLYPSLPPKPEYSDQGDLQIYNPFDVVGWEALANNLKTNYSVVPCPYDWRIDLDKATKFLKDKIVYALNQNKDWKKVDIVAHSMGGLIVRSYIQSEDYNHDIDKFAMVGTPNNGSLKPYFLWEGGNPELADHLPRSSSNPFAPDFYSRVVDNIYFAQTGNKMFALHAASPDCVGGCVWYPLISSAAIREFIAGNNDPNPNKHKISSVPSLKQIMATFKCLSNEKNIETDFNKNTWLIDLNKDPNLSLIQNGGEVTTRIFGSTSEYTLLNLNVKTSSQNGLYEDGEPSGNITQVSKSGDGTVPWDDSCKLTGVEPETNMENGEHSELIGKYKDEITAWLNKDRAFPTAAIEKKTKIAVQDASGASPDTTKGLSISVQGKPAAMITNNSGQRTGIDDDLLTMYEEIPNSSVVRDLSGGSIAINGPAAGFYTVALSGSSIGEVYIKIAFMASDTSGEQDVTLFYPGTQISFTFVYDPTAEQKIIVNSQPPVPENLKATSYTSGGNQLTKLSWSAVSVPDLAGYRIYSRQDNEPYLSLLTTLPAEMTQYQTVHPWNEPRRIYAISAFNNVGKESFLSNFVQNIIYAIASFTADQRSGYNPLTVQFTDTSTGTITGWQWDFGDGSTSTLQNPQHTYTATGTYMVKLNITGAEGTDLKIEPAYITVSELVSTTTTIVPSTTSTALSDVDQDGIPDSQDNCPNKPNGPLLGTCSATSDKPGGNCTSDADCANGCSSNGLCIKDQRDTDADGKGDVCDNCPTNCNSQQLDADQDGIGDVCDTTPGCGGCSGIQCEQQC